MLHNQVAIMWSQISLYTSHRKMNQSVTQYVIIRCITPRLLLVDVMIQQLKKTYIICVHRFGENITDTELHATDCCHLTLLTCNTLHIKLIFVNVCARMCACVCEFTCVHRFSHYYMLSTCKFYTLIVIYIILCKKASGNYFQRIVKNWANSKTKKKSHCFSPIFSNVIFLFCTKLF